MRLQGKPENSRENTKFKKMFTATLQNMKRQKTHFPFLVQLPSFLVDAIALTCCYFLSV